MAPRRRHSGRGPIRFLTTPAIYARTDLPFPGTRRSAYERHDQDGRCQHCGCDRADDECSPMARLGRRITVGLIERAL